MAVALLVTLVPPLLFATSWQEWLYKGLTLLLSGCPCALVISTPAAITTGLAAAVAKGSTQPLEQAIVREAQVAALASGAADSQRAMVGSVIEAQDKGARALICSAGIHPAPAGRSGFIKG